MKWYIELHVQLLRKVDVQHIKNIRRPLFLIMYIF